MALKAWPLKHSLTKLNISMEKLIQTPVGILIIGILQCNWFIINSFEQADNNILFFPLFASEIAISMVNDFVVLRYIWKVINPCIKLREDFSFIGICILDNAPTFNTWI